MAIAPTTEYNHSIPSNPVNLNLNPIKADEDIPNFNSHPPAPTSTLSIPPKPEPFPDRNLFIKDPETEMQVIELDTNVKARYINQDVNSQNAAPEEEFEQPQSQPSLLSDSANTLVDWDSDETWQRRFFKLMDERRRREKQIRLMDQTRQELEVEKRNIAQLMYNIDQQKKALEARETKLFEVEDLIPSAKYLKDIGISFDQALVWIDCIREKAEIERIDLRTAAWKLAQDLRSYKDLGGLSKAIQDATQQLAMLNLVNEQQKRAIAVLQKAGMTEAKLVARWNSSTGVGIGVGVGQGNGGNNTTNNSNNDPNIILKLDDKLNLYKREH